MDASCNNSCSVIQYHKGSEKDNSHAEKSIANSIDSQNSDRQELEEKRREEKILSQNCVDNFNKSIAEQDPGHDDKEIETSTEYNVSVIKREISDNTTDTYDTLEANKLIKTEGYEEVKSHEDTGSIRQDKKSDEESIMTSNDVVTALNNSNADIKNLDVTKDENSDNRIIESQQVTRGKKRKLSTSNDLTNSTNAEDADGNENGLESDLSDEESGKPRRRGRKKGKKAPEVIPSHLSSDMVLGYKMLIKFLETPQFAGFHKPFKRSNGPEDSKITCLNQIKKKFEDNSYKIVCEFVNDIREMLTNIYESRNPVAIKRALRLEQVLEQRIAQLPNYLRPQCALVLPPDEINNSHNKIRISKGGGFVSLLLEKAEKQRYEKNREKRKLLAEERKQSKEEQNKDVQEWEKNVLLKDSEEEIKSMWELPAIGHFIHLCADIFNIGEVAQFEIERMLLMPQCSDTLDLIMTALLTNSLMRAKLDRTPSMPYSIWAPLVRTRVMSWYRTWHKEGRNEQKLFEEIGIEPEFWQILGPDLNPLDYYYFHEISLLQRVWILKTLCDVDFVRKRTVHDNIRAQTLDELNPIYLGMDRHGNRYIQLKQFCGSDIRIYRQSSELEGDISLTEFVSNFEGFEHREGAITIDKVFRDIWELADKPEVKNKRKKISKSKKQKNWNPKIVSSNSLEKKNLRRSARAKQKNYADWSDSDLSDTDLVTLKKKLARPDTETLYRPVSDKEFISLSVFRLPKDKVNKQSSKKYNYISKRSEELNRSDTTLSEKISKMEPEDVKEEVKPGCEDEQSDSLDAKQMLDIQMDFEKQFQSDDVNDDEFDIGEKLSQFNLEQVSDDVKFTVKNIEDLKMVFKKGSTSPLGEESVESEIEIKDEKMEEKHIAAEKEYDRLYKYNVPDRLKPDSSKFYLVVDSVEALRQLISKFGSHENDLEIITRGTKSKKKISQSNTSCEVELIEKLQNLLVELEPWEIDFMKSHRSNKEKMYKEYMNYINRPSDFVHPNESYWMKTYEEPSTTAAASAAVTSGTTSTAVNITAEGTADKGDVKETTGGTSEAVDHNQQDNSLDGFSLRRRTRVTRSQPQQEEKDLDEDSDVGDDYESNESDDNWVLPTPKRKSKKETTNRTPKFPKRVGGRRAKPSSQDKTDVSIATEKIQNLSPDKNKKTLFWGPRSSDPSEDLNWEKNRQKILEQHNSPVKRVLFRSEDSETTKLDFKSQKSETPTSVITASPKRMSAQVPGNKKPYFSSAQLKALENQAKREKSEETQIAQQKAILRSSPNVIMNTQSSVINSFPIGSTSELLVLNSGNATPIKGQQCGRPENSASKQQPIARTAQYVNKSKFSPTKQASVPGNDRIDRASSNAQQPLKISSQVRGSTKNSEGVQKIQNVETFKLDTSGNVIQQKPLSPVQIQIQHQSSPISQNRTVASTVANMRIQWQPKIITVQSINQQGKIVQQQLQTQPQVLQIPSQAQVQLQSQSPVQGQMQQVIHLETQKWGAMQQAIQVPTEKIGGLQQLVIPQGPSSSNASDPDNDLYITDGKLLIKFDNNFVQQYLQKDKAVALNVSEKLDLKKPLLIVKPKTDTNAGLSQAQGEPSTSHQNVLVLNKPVTVQQTVVPSSAPNFVIPANYVVKEDSSVSSQTGQQAVKIVQQPPTYIIQQKPIAGKAPQPQIIKIITSQPLGSNQNLILSPPGLNVNAQAIRPATQTVVSGDPQPKPSTLRFFRPHIPSSPTSSTSKTNPVQNPIIVNSIVQIQGQQQDTSKPQLVAGKVVSTGVTAVRMAAPAQTQTLISAANVGQGVRLATPTVKLVAGSQPQFQIQNVFSSAAANPQTVRPTTANAPKVAPASNIQNQSALPGSTSNLQSILSTGMMNAIPVKAIAGEQSQKSQAHAVVTGLSTQAVAPTTCVSTLTLATSALPDQVQSQTIVTSNNSNLVRPASLSGQAVRLAAVGQTQPVRLIVNDSSGQRVIRNLIPNKATVITSVAQSLGEAPPNVRPTGNAGQPVKLQTVLQSSGPKKTM